MKRCKQCGTESYDSTKKCPGCGGSISKKLNYKQLKFDKKTKIKYGVIIFFSLGVISGVLSEDALPEESVAVESIEENVAVEEVEEVPALSKDEVLSIDSQIFQLVVSSDEVTSILQQSIDALSRGEVSSIDVYDLAKQAKDTQGALYSQFSKLRNEENESYIDAAVSHVLNGQQVANGIFKYLDKEELKYLSEAKSALENTGITSLSVISERTNYLSSQGFSDEEVMDILSPK